MIKIKHYLLPAAILFVGLFALQTQGAFAAPEGGCYNKDTAGAYVESECKQGDPAPQCEVTTNVAGTSKTEKIDCAGIDVTGKVGSNISDIGVDLDGEGVELEGEYYCGKGSKQVRVSFNIGCIGNRYEGLEYNPVLDMLFALLRFVSAGVGVIVTGSIVWAGIQYSTSRGNPQGTEAALKRVANAVIALLIYIFSFAILNFLVPGGLFLR